MRIAEGLLLATDFPHTISPFLSRPSAEEGGLPNADPTWPLSPREEEPGGAECHRAGLSHTTASGSGHSSTQPKVRERGCCTARTMNQVNDSMLHNKHPLKYNFPCAPVPGLAQLVEPPLDFPPVHSAVPGYVIIGQHFCICAKPGQEICCMHKQRYCSYSRCPCSF